MAMALTVAVGLALAVREPRLPREFAHANRPDIEGYEPRLPVGALRPTAYWAPG